MDPQQAIKQLQTSGAASLVFCKRTAQKFSGQHAPISNETADILRSVATDTVAHLTRLQARVYEPDLKINAGEEVLFIPANLIADFKPDQAEQPDDGARLPHSVDRLIDIDNSVIRELVNVAALDMIAVDDIPRSGYNLYAVLVGDDADDCTVYLRYSNPQKFAGKGRTLLAFGEVIKPLGKTIITIESSFDIIVSRHGLLVLQQPVFEKVFRDDLAVLKVKHTQRVAKIAAALPLDETSLQVLETNADKPAVRNKLRAIAENGHLNDTAITAEMIKERAIECDLDPDTVVRDDKLFFSEDTLMPTLKFLNDDFFKGGFSGQLYEAGSKTRRRDN